MTQRRAAIIACNLGGPDKPEAVRPFLFNLFNDKAIIAAPQPMRFALAALISTLRTRTAQGNYAIMGGGSPIVPETEKQAAALDALLARRLAGSGVIAKTFLAMRYWKPLTEDAARAAAAWGATEAIFLPLYPQFSTSTTASSLAAWRRSSKLPTKAVCCYPSEALFLEAHRDRIMEAWRAGGAPPQPRILFSAHGLPQRTIDRGDPYQWQVERTAAGVASLLPSDWQVRICYQSRVGPLKWIGPSTEETLSEAAREGCGVVLCPIAFVSEHVETLVELDHEYAELAAGLGLPYYIRAPALSAAEPFIESLANLVLDALAEPPGAIRSECGVRLCPAAFSQCPNQRTAPDQQPSSREAFTDAG